MCPAGTATQRLLPLRSTTLAHNPGTPLQPPHLGSGPQDRGRTCFVRVQPRWCPGRTPDVGAGVCPQCLGGTYQDNPGQETCKPCDPGAYCAEGAAALLDVPEQHDALVDRAVSRDRPLGRPEPKEVGAMLERRPRALPARSANGQGDDEHSTFLKKCTSQKSKLADLLVESRARPILHNGGTDIFKIESLRSAAPLVA